MDLATLNVELANLLPAIGGAVGGALLLFVAVTALTACSVPGVLIPMSLTGGLLLGPAVAVATVIAGAITGSLLLFALTRRIGAERLRQRFGHRLAPLEDRMARFGPYGVVALRLVGAPGPLITAGAALTAMRRTPFAIATLVGLLPSVVLAATGPGLLLG
ncbi:VTT domain-containing protein [Sphingomonas sp. LHG3406-1]|uniref:VTT domain-containing protein n=1 Tax=Sphingomonas sp. LHG3406-1 TaxID=2804617 RepID=UPI00260CD1E2|nr:VTT domain-containing protein [Sphingomonas sp. LHG3406-1]